MSEPAKSDTTTRKPLPMRVVIKGWWTYAEREVQSDALERFDVMRGRLKHRPWWRGLNRKWQK